MDPSSAPTVTNLPPPLPVQALPYATPAGLAPQNAGGVWRDSMLLVTTATASLPKHCVRCGAPADGAYRQRKFYWHEPLLFLLILAGILIYAIVALIVRKGATIEVGLCAMHQRRRTMGILVGWILGIGGFVAMIGGIILAEEMDLDMLAPIAVLGAFVFWIVGAIIGTRAARILTPTKIDAQYAWFKHVDPRFLDLLPPVR
jgi:hypothetical protein